MAITVSGTSITFNDGTTQTTAASGYTGAGGTVYTTAGSFTFTIPSGITKLKVTVIGGGAGGFYSYVSGCCTINVFGTSGGTSSVASGTQTISTISATGGAAWGGVSGGTNGGLGSGGDLNGRGGGGGLIGSQGTPPGQTIFSGAAQAAGGTAVLGTGGLGYGSQRNYGGSAGGSAIKWLTGLTAGNTLSVTVGAKGTNSYSSTADGAPGVVVFEY